MSKEQKKARKIVAVITIILFVALALLAVGIDNCNFNPREWDWMTLDNLLLLCSWVALSLICWIIRNNLLEGTMLQNIFIIVIAGFSVGLLTYFAFNQPSAVKVISYLYANLTLIALSGVKLSKQP